MEVGEPTSTVHRKESIDMLRLESNSRARAFTITEMLVTVGVIVILAGILITTLSKAARTAQQGRTVQLMTAISGQQLLARYLAVAEGGAPANANDSDGPGRTDL